MGQRGPAVFFDGVTSRRQQVIVDLAGTIEIREQGSDRLLAAWPYSSLAQTHTPDGTLRIGRSDDPGAARLEIRDEPLARAIDEMSLPIDRTGRKERRERLVVVGWGIAAVVSLALVAVYGLPAIADRLAPLLPTGFEQSVGRGVDQQVRAALNPENRADFVCTGSPAAQAALARMVNRLVGVAQLHVPVQVQVIRRPEVNAIALPGGYVYIFDGLIQRSLSGDQVAAVFAHELGHVANRDGMRSLLQQAGVAVILGVVIGDLGGSSLVIAATRNLLQARYSREVEASADLYGILLLDRAGLDPRALAAALQRLPNATRNDPNILATHPNIPERVATLEANARAGARGEPVMSPADFQALRGMCGGAR